MKLLGAFCKVLETSGEETGFCATIQLDPGHEIYKGHFPGFPVTPGVIQIQIVHELLEERLGMALKLKSMSECKFLKVLDPNETAQIVVRIELEQKKEFIKIKARGNNEVDTFFKITAIYQIANDQGSGSG